MMAVVVDNSITTFIICEGALGGDGFGGWRVAEDEEFDEDAEQDYDGDLAEEKPFGEG